MPPAAATQTNGKRFTLADLTTTAKARPSAIVLHGIPGVGKTSFAAQAPGAVIIPTETGIDTLIAAKQVKETPHWPKVDSWENLQGIVAELITSKHDYKTAVFDTINGCEQLCHEYVCRTQYSGDWGPKGFANYQQGFKRALPVWQEFLASLDRLRDRGMGIIGIVHTKISTFKDPTTADYDRYTPDMHHEKWPLTEAWADIVLFYTYETIVSESDVEKKGKATNQVRTLFTERTAVWDAKNRHGLPTAIPAGATPIETWANFISELQKAKAE